MKQAAVLALLVLATAACDNGHATPRGGVSVVASFYPLAEIATAIGGGRVHVTNLTSAGTEPHDLELSPDQIDLIQDADLVLYLGDGFQPVVEKAVRTRDRSPGTVDVLAAVEAPDAGDPHVWLDPQRMKQMATAVERALAAMDLSGQAVYERGAEHYRSQVDSLDSDYRRGLAACERHEIVTAHAAFQYLAERYGLRQQAIAGLSPEAEPDPKRLAQLADEIQRTGVTTVFTEELVSPRVAQALAREAHVTTAVLDPIEGITAEHLRQGATYLTIMRENLAKLRKALACS